MHTYDSGKLYGTKYQMHNNKLKWNIAKRETNVCTAEKLCYFCVLCKQIIPEFNKMDNNIKFKIENINHAHESE